MQEKELPILSVVQVGHPEFPRYTVCDEEDRVWTGEDLSDDPQAALLFLSNNSACGEVHRLLKQMCGDRRRFRLIAPVEIEVYSDEPVPLSGLIQYLCDASRLWLDIPEMGYGPGDSLVLPTILWHEIQEVDRNATG